MNDERITAAGMLLFPQLTDKTWAYVNLNQIAQEASADDLREPDERLIEMLHRTLGVDYTWGGWMEDRTFLMRNQYHKPGHAWHLGVDYNVPLNTEVHMPIAGKLLHEEMDPDQDGGWGGKLIFETAKGYMILGHLDQIVGSYGWVYKKGDVVGIIGDESINGGWFPHLHVQFCRVFDSRVDGYSHRYYGMELDFPDPEEQLR